KNVATASMINPEPSAPALVVACMRISKSGMRRAPSAASSISSEPTSNSRAAIASVISVDPPLFQKSCKADRGKKRSQCQYHRDIKKGKTLCSDGVDADKAHRQRGHQF